MKLLANIFLSGLAILACVSCSKDEDPVLSLEGAKLSVAVKASGTATKAYNPNDVNELEGEAYINNLAVVVFNETGTELLGYKWEASFRGGTFRHNSRCADNEGCPGTDHCLGERAERFIIYHFYLR